MPNKLDKCEGIRVNASVSRKRASERIEATESRGQKRKQERSIEKGDSYNNTVLRVVERFVSPRAGGVTYLADTVATETQVESAWFMAAPFPKHLDGLTPCGAKRYRLRVVV